MPTIKIREVDTSTAGVLNPTTNVAYVPGYAITGPINTPVLCETLADFQKIFGITPYRYYYNHKPASGDPAITPTVYADSYETSYIYAADLLRLGLPILFERVEPEPNGDNTFHWFTTASVKGKDTQEPAGDVTVTLSSVYPGKISGNLCFYITKDTYTYTDASGNRHENVEYYNIFVKQTRNISSGTTEIPYAATKFTFDEGLSLAVPTIKFANGHTLRDSTGLVDITFPVDIASIVMINPGTGESVVGTLDDPISLTFSDAEYAATHDEFTPAYLCKKMEATPSIFSKLEDKGIYTIKFITSGGYPTITTDDSVAASNIITTATNRGDCTALIDYHNSLKVSDSDNTAYTVVSKWASALDSSPEPKGNYGAAFAPWAVFNSATTKSQIRMAPSFAYLSAYANSTQSNANWYAVAGVTRGFVPNLVGLEERISNSLGNKMQPRSEGTAMNPIMEIQPYGNVIWGNRTLKNNTPAGELTATSFLNVRQLSNDVKRVTWVACRACTFEPNSDMLWINFIAKITPVLDQMKGNNGLSNYKITRLPTDKKATIVARITLFCIEAVEDFDITVELTDNQITIA